MAGLACQRSQVRGFVGKKCVSLFRFMAIATRAHGVMPGQVHRLRRNVATREVVFGASQIDRQVFFSGLIPQVLLRVFLNHAPWVVYREMTIDANQSGGGVNVPGEVHLLLPNHVGRDRVADLGAVVDPASLLRAAHDVGVLNRLNRGGISGRKAMALGTVFKCRIREVKRLRLHRAIAIESTVIVGECTALLPDHDPCIDEGRIVGPTKVARRHFFLALTTARFRNMT